ncbi:MAG: 1-acyl-sn-glycerol-3-phosphate acyltransferase [Caldilineaceae bacterium]
MRIFCDDVAQMRRLHGLIFCNHLSYLDIMVLLSVAPVRFLSARGVQRIPFVGWIATAIDTVFVNRGDQASRAAVRTTLADQLRAQAYPPLVLFPGQVGPGDQVLPFRRRL